MSTWNKKNFSIYTSDERSALGLIEELGNQTNYNTEEIERVKESDNKKVSHDEMNRIYKIDKNADFTGSWHGIKKPTASQEGLQATVDKIVEEDIPSINEQLEENTNQISIINKTKYIFFGDSYAEGYSPDGNTISWCRHVKNLLKISDDDYYSFYKGGYGFVNGGFMSLLTNAINTITDKYNVKYIIVGGGYNDATEDYITELPSKMKEWIDLCRTNFPNAKILIAPFGWCVEGLTTGVHANRKIETLVKMVLAYQRNSLINGACYVDGIYSCLHANKFFSSDYVHPNQNGQYNIALQLANYLKTGGFNTSEYMSGFNSSNNIDCFENNIYEDGITSDLKCWAIIDGKSTILNLTEGKITGTFDNLSLNGSSLLLGTIRSATINGINSTINFNFPAILKSTSNKYYKADATLRVTANKLYIELVSINNTNDNFISDSFTEIKIFNPPTTLAINSLLN